MIGTSNVTHTGGGGASEGASGSGSIGAWNNLDCQLGSPVVKPVDNSTLYFESDSGREKITAFDSMKPWLGMADLPDWVRPDGSVQLDRSTVASITIIDSQISLAVF
jgi:hypothetical protein